MVADRQHLFGVEVQRTAGVDRGESPLVGAAYRDDQCSDGFASTRVQRLDGAPSPPFDDRVGDDSSDDLVGQFVRYVVAETDPAPGSSGLDVDAELLTRVANCISSAVGHTGLECDLHGMADRKVPISSLE